MLRLPYRLLITTEPLEKKAQGIIFKFLKQVLSEGNLKNIGSWNTCSITQFCTTWLKHNLKAKRRKKKTYLIDFYFIAITCQSCLLEDKAIAQRHLIEVVFSFRKISLPFGTNLCLGPSFRSSHCFPNTANDLFRKVTISFVFGKPHQDDGAARWPHLLVVATITGK